MILEMRPTAPDGSSLPSAATFPPPSVGAHTRAVLEKTGLDAAAIDELLRSGVIGEPPAT